VVRRDVEDLAVEPLGAAGIALAMTLPRLGRPIVGRVVGDARAALRGGGQSNSASIAL
jgi:hypothetical protein